MRYRKVFLAKRRNIGGSPILVVLCALCEPLSLCGCRAAFGLIVAGGDSPGFNLRGSSKLPNIQTSKLPDKLPNKKRGRERMLAALWGKSRRRATLPRANPAVPSPMRPFTSVFGMGTGVSSSLWPPGKQSNVSGMRRAPRGASQSCAKCVTASLWAISIGWLSALLRLTPPTYQGGSLPPAFSALRQGRSCLWGGLALRCFQRLSVPHIATRRVPLA